MISRVPGRSCMPSGTMTRSSLRSSPLRLDQLHDRDRHAVFQPAVFGGGADFLGARLVALAADLHPRRIHELRRFGRRRRLLLRQRGAGAGAAGLAGAFLGGLGRCASAAGATTSGRADARTAATMAVNARPKAAPMRSDDPFNCPLLSPFAAQGYVPDMAAPNGRPTRRLCRLSQRQIRHERDAAPLPDSRIRACNKAKN